MASLPRSNDIFDTDDLIRWFTYNMSMDMRRKLMAEMPIHYAKLYPEVSASGIAQIVKERIEAMREEQRAKLGR